MRIRVRCILMAPFVVGVALQAQPPDAIPSTPSCTGCRIVIRRIATLGLGGDSVSLSRQTRVVMDSHGRFYAAPTYLPGTIALYDSRGRLIKVAGRRGEGPGEFVGDFSQLIVGPGDSLYVIEGVTHSVLAPGLGAVVRRRPLAIQSYFTLLFPSGDLLAQRGLVGSSGASQPLHVLAVDGGIRRSFGASNTERVPSDVWETSRTIGLSHAGDVWVGRRNRYELELWSSTGSLKQRLRRDADWFPSWSGFIRGEGTRVRPRPVLGLAAEDPQGLLWTVVSVAAHKWSPDLRGGELSPLDVDKNANRDSMIEVITPQTRRVIARARIEAAIFGIADAHDARVLYTHRATSSGEIAVDVWRAELIGQPSKP